MRAVPIAAHGAFGSHARHEEATAPAVGLSFHVWRTKQHVEVEFRCRGVIPRRPEGDGVAEVPARGVGPRQLARRIHRIVVPGGAAIPSSLGSAGPTFRV
jgi:hypothetical protein